MEENNRSAVEQTPPVPEAEPQADGSAASPRRGWFRRHLKLCAVLAILAAAAAAIAVMFFKRRAVSAASGYEYVRTTTLSTTSLNDSVTVNGTVKSGDEASVTVSDSAKTYKVAAVNVEVGDTVQEGDVIATLDTADLEKQIENAEEDYAETLQSAQTSYDRAVDDYNTAVVEHENKLIDLQTGITEADEALSEAQDSQSEAQSSYDSAQSAYSSLKATYDAAAAQVSAFQSAYDEAAAAKNSAVTALNDAAAKYQNAYSAARAALDAGGEVNTAEVLSAAQSMADAYLAYNGNSVQGGMTIPASLDSDLAAVGIEGTNLAGSGSDYSASACGQYDTAQKNLTDARSSVSAAGYTGLDSLEAAVSAAQQTMNAASTALEQAKSAAESAEKQVTSAHQSYDSEKNSTTLKSRAQSVEDAKTKLEQARKTPDTLTTLRDTLEECTLTATMSGTITELNATVGSACTGTVATIQDTDALVVEVTIPADSVPSLSAGMACEITSDATGDETITGTLTQIDPVASSTGAFGAKVRVTGDRGDLLIGIQAQVEIIKNAADGVFTVPIDAVGTAEDGSSYVLRKTGGEGVDMTFEEVTVTTGDANDYYIIISGDALNEGDVIRASADLSEGIVTGSGTESIEEMVGNIREERGGGEMGGGNFGGDMGGAPAGGPGGN